MPVNRPHWRGISIQIGANQMDLLGCNTETIKPAPPPELTVSRGPLVEWAPWRSIIQVTPGWFRIPSKHRMGELAPTNKHFLMLSSDASKEPERVGKCVAPCPKCALFVRKGLFKNLPNALSCPWFSELSNSLFCFIFPLTGIWLEKQIQSLNFPICVGYVMKIPYGWFGSPWLDSR